MKNLGNIIGSIFLATGFLGCATKDVPIYSEAPQVQPLKQEERRAHSMTLSWTIDPNEEKVWAYSVYIGKQGQNTNMLHPLLITTTISGLEPGEQYGVGVKTYNSKGEEVSLPFSKK